MSETFKRLIESASDESNEHREHDAGLAKELEAMAVVGMTLSRLDPSASERIVPWVRRRYGGPTVLQQVMDSVTQAMRSFPMTHSPVSRVEPLGEMTMGPGTYWSETAGKYVAPGDPMWSADEFVKATGEYPQDPEPARGEG